MKFDKAHREEIIAKLLATYRDELNGLTDEELQFHLWAQKRMEKMTPQEWQEMMK